MGIIPFWGFDILKLALMCAFLVLHAAKFHNERDEFIYLRSYAAALAIGRPALLAPLHQLDLCFQIAQ